MMDFLTDKSELIDDGSVRLNDSRALVESYEAITQFPSDIPSSGPTSLALSGNQDETRSPVPRPISSISETHAAQLRTQLTKVDIPDEWPEELSQAVQDSVMVPRLLLDNSHDPMKELCEEVGWISVMDDEATDATTQDKPFRLHCPVFSCEQPSLGGFRHCELHVKYARKRLQIPDSIRKPKWSKHYDFLREWARSCDKGVGQIWGIDVEYVVFNYATPLALPICIKRYSDNSDVINTLVDYAGRTADELIGAYDEICPAGFMLNKRVRTSLRSSFKHYYPGGRAWGMTFGNMRKAILDAGFDLDPRTHAVISYSTSLDLR